MQRSVATTCPSCGQQLSVVALDADTPPWCCFGCRIGFWPSQLTPDARATWRPAFHDHGTSLFAVALRDQIEADREQAHRRGTGMLEGQIPLAATDALQGLARVLAGASQTLYPDAAGLHTRIVAELAGRH